jgi:hypothetical protein
LSPRDWLGATPVGGATGFAHSTVWKVLRRAGISRPPRTRGCRNSVGAGGGAAGGAFVDVAVASAAVLWKSFLGLSLVYVVVCRLFELVVLLGRRERSKELEILVLRHELSILRRQADRPPFEPSDRLLLGALSRVLPRRSWQAFIVRPETLLRWQRRLVANMDVPAPTTESAAGCG